MSRYSLSTFSLPDHNWLGREMYSSDASVVTCCPCVCFQAATRSQQCSATLRRSCCVLAVQQSCVSPPEAKHVSQRVSIKPLCSSLAPGCFMWICIIRSIWFPLCNVHNIKLLLHSLNKGPLISLLFHVLWLCDVRCSPVKWAPNAITVLGENHRKAEVMIKTGARIDNWQG